MKQALIAFVAVTLVGCGGGVDVTAELKRVAGGSPSGRSGSRATNATSDVTIESLKIPIRDVSLGTGEALSGGEGNAEIIYECPGSSGPECLVELVGPALENLFATAGGTYVHPVPVGDYTSVMVATCFEEGSYSVEIKASATLGTMTYYTRTGSTTLVTDPAQYGPITMTFNGCRNYSILSSPITIGESGGTVSLFVDLRAVAAVFASGQGEAYGNCSADNSGTGAGAPVLCLTYPNVAGGLNVSTPTIERYSLALSNAASTKPVLGLYLDPATGAPLSGYFRYLFDDTFTSTTPLPSTFKKAQLTGGQLLVTDYVSTATNTISGNGDFTVTDFPRPTVGNTSGSTPWVDKDGNPSGNTFTATRLD